MIKIFSAYSNVGGSTEVFINLINAFNNIGYDSVLYGPHPYPKDRCNFKHWDGLTMDIRTTDNVVVHFIDAKLDCRPDVKKFLLSVHELEMFPLKQKNYFPYDKIVYVSEHQKAYHNIRHPSIVIPNPVTRLNPTTIDERVAGVVGWIQPNKGTARGIRNALNDGFEKVLIYGTVGDQDYWYDEVVPLIDGERVQYHGYEEDKQKIYNSISHLYIASNSESFSLSANEALSAGVEVVASTHITRSTVTNEDIYKMWIREFNCD
jgi:glycosyltransferase involved in cell wall biosynthesis